MLDIDDTYWQKNLKRPDWYTYLMPGFNKLEKQLKSLGDKDRKPIKAKIYELVEQAYETGQMPIGSNGKNFDLERKYVDTIVIHHTKNQPGMTLARLNAIQLLRIYGNYYANSKEKDVINHPPVWSGHFFFGKQVFWSYHWLIRQNGQAERILQDDYIGWHAGNWDINCRSVAICIDDNLSDKNPSEVQLQTVKNIIKDYYPEIKPGRVLGHKEVNPKTECPGNLFENWKPKLFLN